MRKHASFHFRTAAMLLFFFAAAFLLPACRTGETKLYLLAAAVPGVMLLLMILPAGIFALDRPSLSAALSLCGFGLLATADISPDETVSQGMRCVAALAFLAVGAVLVRSFSPSAAAAALPAVCGLGMLSCPLWLPDVPFSLNEGGMVLLFFAVSAFLSVRLRLPALTAALGGSLLLLLQQDYGSALIWGLSCMLVFWAASDSAVWSGILLGGTAGLFGLFFGFAPPQAETAAQSLLSRIAGMPLIPPETLPETAVETSADSLFFLLGDRYGLVFLLCAVLFLILILIRGASLAQHTRKSFHASLALGVVLLAGLRALLFLAATAGLLPLAPGFFPFMTSSMPDLFAHFFLLGLLSGVSARNEADLEEDARLAMLAR